jgi:hypothetical protein
VILAASLSKSSHANYLPQKHATRLNNYLASNFQKSELKATWQQLEAEALSLIQDR